MSNRTVVSAVAAIATVLLAGAAWAHHNMSAMFDFNDRVTLTGTLTKIDWRNPHIGLTVDVKGADAKMQSWSVEGPPPGFFRTRDVNKTNVDAALGKSVTFEASRARDGSQSGLLRTMTLPDGAVLSACPQNC
jgi:Family of unknown function (DUF6152)